MVKTFKICVRRHIKHHPKAQPQDIYKLCFQAAFGAEHLLRDEEKARQYLQREYESVEIMQAESDADSLSILEWIAPEVVRVHLAGYKAKGFSVEILFRAFVDSAREFKGEKKTLEEYLSVIKQMALDGEMNFTVEEWVTFCDGREIAPVHHSNIFREAYKPAYRVITGKYIMDLGIPVTKNQPS